MGYEYEDELERMKKRRSASRRKESDFINRRQDQFEERKIRRARALRKRRKKQKMMRIAAVIAVVLVIFAGISLFKGLTDDGYWTIAVFGVDSRDGNL